MIKVNRSTNGSESEIIRGYKPNHLYNHEFDKGRFFQVVHEDEDGFEAKLAARTMLKVVYLKENDDIEGFEIIKLVGDSEKQRVAVSKFNFAQLKQFLSFISQIDLKGITERRIKLIDDANLDEATIRKIKTLLSNKGGTELIESVIAEGLITSRDIVNTGFRKRGLQIFSLLMSDGNYWKKYAEENNLGNTQEEKAWQFFFEKNEWIFGYGLDYRFKSILQREAFVSDTEIDGSNAVIADYLLGDRRFTTFVELKKPSTSLFGKSKNRSNSWSLSNDLIDSVSQILEQKASGLIKLEGENFNSEGLLITQKPYDSKVVLIIGNWQELDQSKTDLEKKIKQKTFELYRRDSRNIEIVTYDELYERARYILEGDTAGKSSSKEEKLTAKENVISERFEITSEDDLPF